MDLTKMMTPQLFHRYLMHSHNSSCSITTQYIPSAIETTWVTTIESMTKEIMAGKNYDVVKGDLDIQKWSIPCALIEKQASEVHKWLDYQALRADEAPCDNVDSLCGGKIQNGWTDATNVLSYFEYWVECEGHEKKQLLKTPIEPLFGMLRHPRAVATDETDTRCGNVHFFNRDYLIPLIHFESVPPLHPPHTRNFYFDLGASTYTGGAGGASMSWFIDTYKKNGIMFDRVLAWESNVINPKEIFNSLPDYPYNVMSYYNIPADPDVKSSQNPLNVLKSIAKQTDLVIMKIDIDAEKVEADFMNDILNDESISSLIDELYFEHHVGLHPMEYPWWRDNPQWQPPIANITESFQLFEKLRKLGIRAHSWV